ncbi:hypothetical protein [Armatimonas rosea]|uniref:Uncharacterized protein n=1 Tax=Armatimonas rosea TaxID=685828 RepID=A0A7W9W8G6_ARMRO|nr:hypothetical protein [Armatimonas rosea]MBB6052743.1 hypothetical protein [Armatimonas rosea]
MKPLSINQALDQLDSLAGTEVIVYGQLGFEFEHVALYHLPKAERRGEIESSLWISVGTGSLGFDRDVCRRWHGKTVRIEGKLLKPSPFFGGCGHGSLWPAEILARTIQRYQQHPEP